jgi:hypothetical protein
MKGGVCVEETERLAQERQHHWSEISNGNWTRDRAARIDQITKLLNGHLDDESKGGYGLYGERRKARIQSSTRR